MSFSRRKYRQRYLRWHKQYEKRSATEIKKVFKKWLSNIKWGDLDEFNYSLMIDESINQKELEKAYYTIYYEIGKEHGKRVGKEINQGLKEFTFVGFMTIFDFAIREYFMQYGINRIVTVRNTFFESIMDLIKAGLDEGKSMSVVAREIEPMVNKKEFTRWMAERIARTESTAASNYAALQAGNVTGFKMQKEWISAQDARTRRKPKAQYDHYIMHGKRVGINDLFYMNGKEFYNEDALRFPGDPKGKPGNVINCRCTVAVVPLRDKEGNLIPN